MVLEMSVSLDIGLRNMERRTSSPIGIPSAKLASLRAIDQQAIAENQLSDEHQQAASPKSAPQHGGSPGIDMYLEGLPEGSPAFSHVYTELTKMKELVDELETKMRVDDHSVESKVEEKDREDNKKSAATDAHRSPQRSPQHVRKQTKTLTFNCENTNHSKGSTLFRRRTKSASSHRTTQVKDNQYKMHPTPSLVRKERASKGNVNSSKFVFHIIPKYKFLTETVTVSHEDLVKEQEIEQQLQSPKSIFGSLDEKTYSG